MFAYEMERVLKANDHKGGWEKCDIAFFVGKLKEEQGELIEALWHYDIDDNKTDVVKLGIVKEAADLANIAMMVYDNLMKGRI